MSYVYVVALVNWCAIFAVERWGRPRLLNLSNRLLFDRIGCVPLTLPLLLYLPSLFFGTVLLTLSNLYWLGDVLEEHAFLFAISTASHPIIHVSCDSFHFIRKYLNVRRRQGESEADGKLGELWGMDRSNIRVIRARNGGIFPEDLDVDTLREFRIRTLDHRGNPTRPYQGVYRRRTSLEEFIEEELIDRLD